MTNEELIEQGISQASLLIKGKEYGLARILLTQGIKTFPQADVFHGLLGMVEGQEGNQEKAIERFNEAIHLNPTDPSHWNNLGLAYEGSRPLKAESKYRRAIHYGPNYGPAYSNLAMLLRKQGDTEQALELLEKALASNDELAYCQFNKGNILGEQGEVEASVTCHKRAIEADPFTPEYRFNYACGLLLLGRWKEAWPHFQARWEVFPQYQLKRDVLNGVAPEWTGEDLDGKRIYLYCTQGDGDKIQFIRYAKLLKDQGATVIVEAPVSLQELFANVEGVDELAPLQCTFKVTPLGQSVGFVLDKANLPTFDFHCEMLELPRLLNTTPENIPNAPYLRGDWNHKIETDVPKIGLVWAGNPNHHNDHNRSCDLSYFEPLGKLDVLLVGLQKDKRPRVYPDPWGGDMVADLAKANPTFKKRIVDFSGDWQSYHDTADIIHDLDLVITVDTSVAHLAGAMGKPVWVMLPFAPDWRWMLNTETTPWYPSMRLFRQPKPGDWWTVIKNILHAIDKNEPFCMQPKGVKEYGSISNR